MHPSNSDSIIAINRAKRSVRVGCEPRRIPVFTRRQFLSGALTIAAAMSATEVIYAAPVTIGKIRVVVSNTDDYRRGLKLLSSRYKAALVDIGAEWCDYCKIIDQEILPDPDVQRAMEHVALLRVDVTRIGQDSQELLHHLRADGPPTLFIVDTANGREFSGTRSVGVFKASDLVRRLGRFARY